jgi:hypothetical protein
MDLCHRFQLSTRMRVPFIRGASVGPEAVAPAPREGAVSERGRVRRVRVVATGVDGLQFPLPPHLLAVSSDEK